MPKMPVPHGLMDKQLRVPWVWPNIACRTEIGVVIPRRSAKCWLRHPEERREQTIINARANTNGKLLYRGSNWPSRPKHTGPHSGS